MLSDKFANSLLHARDRRQDALTRVLGQGAQATLFLSMNIPGTQKTPPGAEALFEWMLDEMARTFPGIVLHGKFRDSLGHYAILGVNMDPVEAKQYCISLEESHPSARLIDLDVYAPSCTQVSRSSLDLPGRRCLVCDLPAVDCIRVKRHALDEVVGCTHALLAPFSA